MTVMMQLARRVLGLARRIAGHRRSEWSAAMAAEMDVMRRGQLGWALGCLGAAARDRLWREWPFLLALLAAPALAIIWTVLLMTAAAPILRGWGLLGPLWLAIYLCAPLPVPFLLGWLYPRRALFIGCFAGTLHLLAPMILMAVLFGVPPTRWFAASAKSLSMSPPFLGFAVMIGTWMAAAMLASWLSPRRRVAAG